MASCQGHAVIEPLEKRRMLNATPTILFVRGATRSGGFLEGTTAATRNEQLADINNTSTAAGNAGWGTLAATLRSAGFAVEQITETKELDAPATGFVNGRPIHFENLDLSKYAAIVFGSNNARYPKASVDAVQTYIQNGGGALFISDANFGSNWRDAPDSDQQFLSRFGLVVNQDAAAGTTTLSRSAGNFALSNDPVLNDVDSFTGEGVSPIVVPEKSPPAVTIRRVVAATGQTRNNDGIDSASQYQGSLRNTTDHDAALVLANSGDGRVAAFFDRNTFFNANGVGTDITKANNRQLALNLFGWIADNTPPKVASTSFHQGAPSELKITFDDVLEGLTRRDILLRNPLDATPIPKTRWSFALAASAGQTTLTVRIKAAQPPGLYQLQINRGRFTDDADNVNGRIRFNFTIASTSPAMSVPPAQPSQQISSHLAETLFDSSTPIV